MELVLGSDVLASFCTILWLENKLKILSIVHKNQG